MRAVAMLAAACGFACISHADLLAQSFPYTATINAQAPFYGQAGDAAPPCGYLAVGSSVEVYKNEAGWLAVRPPVGSFSWVSGDEVSATAQSDVVQVGAAGAKGWIGHQGNNERTISQVTLNPGEPLKVVGEATLIATGQPVKWYKIAPPPGEFRYVPAQYVGVQPAVAAVKQVNQQVAAATGTTLPTAQPASWTARGSRDSMVAVQPAVSQHTIVARPTPQATAVVQAAFTTQAPQPSTLPATAQPVETASLVQEPTVSPASPTAPVNTDPAQQRLDLLENYINAMIAQPPATWNTVPLAVELQALAATAPTPASRVRAGELWTKVYQCQQIQSAYTQISATMQTAALPQAPTANPWNAAPQATVTPASYTATQSTSPIQLAPEIKALAPRNVFARMRENIRAASQPDAQPATPIVQPAAGQPFTPPVTATTIPTTIAAPTTDAESTAPTVQTASLTPVADANFSGKGWLMPLVGRSQMPLDSRAGVPPYALTDGEGNVKFYVTPTPGMNISQYLRQEVGIAGPANQLPNLTSPHLTAQRVVVLGRHE